MGGRKKGTLRILLLPPVFNMELKTLVARRSAWEREVIMDIFMMSMTENCFHKDGISGEIGRDGNLYITAYMPDITVCEIRSFQRDFNAYYYERKGKAAILLDGMRYEMVINPSYYTDDRFEKLQKKEKVYCICKLVDTHLHMVVDVKVCEIEGKELCYLKKMLLLNNEFTRDELEEWIVTVLYARGYENNRRESVYVGKVRESTDIQVYFMEADE